MHWSMDIVHVGSGSMTDLGRKRAKGKGAPVAADRLGIVLEEYVDMCVQSGCKAFAVGKYVSLKMNGTADAPSLVVMAPVLKALFGEAPVGIVNRETLKAALLNLLAKKPFIYTGKQAKDDWADVLANSLRVAMAHCRLMKLITGRFEQRTKGLSGEDKKILLEVLAMYKPEAGSGIEDTQGQDSQEAQEATEVPTRVLKKVATDDLDFESMTQGLGEHELAKGQVRRPKKKQKTVNMAKLLVDALSADPVDPRLKQVIKKKPASCVAKVATTRTTDDEEPELPEEEEEEEEGDGFNEEGEEENEEGFEGEEEEEEDTGLDEEEAEEEPQEPEGTVEDRGIATSRMLRVTKANKRTYITEKLDDDKWHLVVEVSENMSGQHAQIIETIKRAIEEENLDKKGALKLRAQILGQ